MMLEQRGAVRFVWNVCLLTEKESVMNKRMEGCQSSWRAQLGLVEGPIIQHMMLRQRMAIGLERGFVE
jgi:hypothetical protein